MSQERKTATEAMIELRAETNAPTYESIHRLGLNILGSMDSLAIAGTASQAAQMLAEIRDWATELSMEANIMLAALVEKETGK